MCGICGLIDWTGSISIGPAIAAMTDILRHRGPDAQNTIIHGNTGLGSTRLSILDLDHRADMPLYSTDGNSAIVLNGEIYNHRELKNELEKAGASFRTTSDTEVLLELLRRKGEKGIAELDGMFAFAFLNLEKKEILIARDRIGMKPLYYLSDPQSLFFSSEIKSIWNAREKQHTLSETSHKDIFNIGYNYGSTTLFMEVRALLPGHYLKISMDKPEIKIARFADILEGISAGYWREKSGSDKTDIKQQMRSSVEKAVQTHCISDARIGVICSGGVDSSLLAVLASRERDDLELYHASISGGANELSWAQNVSKLTRRPLHTVAINPVSFIGNWVQCIFHSDAPSYHPNDIPFYLICQLARDHERKVLLSGEGADELFGGYHVNLELQRRRFWQSLLPRIPRRIQKLIDPLAESSVCRMEPAARHMVSALGLGSIDRISGLMRACMLTQAGSERMRQASRILERLDFLPDTEKAAAVYLTERLFSHLVTLLMRNDKMGMQASIETRIPFLSNQILSEWIGMPMKFKTQGKHHKGLKFLLKEIASEYLPKEQIFRSKIGFSIPLAEYVRPNPDFFSGGFLQDYFHLGKEHLHLFSESHETFFRMASVDIWARLFLMKQDAGNIQEHLTTCCSRQKP